MSFHDTATLAAFRDDKLAKVNLHESPRMFCDVYGLMPGQSQDGHVHAANDKVYAVLTGRCRVDVGGKSQVLSAGQVAVARAGVDHGLHNESQERTTLLVIMAPNPTTNFPGGIETVDNAVFERAWKVAVECGEEERHFNHLQSVYRGIASTWLLGAIGAMGYLRYGEHPVKSPLVSAAICLAGAVGIGLIWLLDLHVYHRLLVSVFSQGRELEERFAWMPRLRSTMRGVGRRRPEKRSDPIRRRLGAYYLVTIAALLVPFLYFLWQTLKERTGANHVSHLVTLVVGACAAGLLLLFFKLFTSEDD